MNKISPEEAMAKVRAVFGDTVEVKSVDTDVVEEGDSDAEVVDLITRVCYFYPQYTLETAEILTNAQVTALLLQAEKQRAIEMYNHVLIAASPHSKKGKMVNELLKKYKKVIEL